MRPFTLVHLPSEVAMPLHCFYHLYVNDFCNLLLAMIKHIREEIFIDFRCSKLKDKIQAIPPLEVDTEMDAATAWKYHPAAARCPHSSLSPARRPPSSTAVIRIKQNSIKSNQTEWYPPLQVDPEMDAATAWKCRLLFGNNDNEMYYTK